MESNLPTSCLKSREDLQWLQEVHGVDTTAAKVAIIYGNEDSPSKVQVYAEDDYRCTPVVWVSNEEGTLTKESDMPGATFDVDYEL